MPSMTIGLVIVLVVVLATGPWHEDFYQILQIADILEKIPSKTSLRGLVKVFVRRSC